MNFFNISFKSAEAAHCNIGNNFKKENKLFSCKTKVIAAALSVITALNASSVLTVSAADEAPRKTMVLGGQPFGVKFFSDGIMITELEDFFSDGRYICPAREGGLAVGDVIKKVNGTKVANNEDLQLAAFGSDGNPVVFTVERNGKELVKTVTPKKNMAGSYLLGAWVRDSCAGIGTVTFYDPGNNYFAALGHGICDSDTSELMPLGKAEVVSVSISSASKSSAGKAGSLNGYFTDKVLGKLTKNTDCGVFGTTNDNNLQNGVSLELAENGEIHVGKAKIYTTVKGSESASYEAEIISICSLDSGINENFVIKITDLNLLDECGGIVQGMSGSPVVQDGRLVGAVTHVFLNSPEEGYGITAQNMVSKYKE